MKSFLENITMLAMADKKAKTLKVSQKRKPKRKGSPLNCWIDSELKKVLDQFVGEADPQYTVRAVVESSLKTFFRSRNLWPEESKD